MYRVIFLIVFLVSGLQRIYGQINEAELVNFTQKDGLPSNEAYCVIRDSRNFIWIATDQGVVRFNGSKMEKFELPDNVVFKIREDQKGRIWFFTHTGKLAYFKDEKVWPFRYNDSIRKISESILITDAYVTSDDEIILNSITNGNYSIASDGRIRTTGSSIHDLTEIDIWPTGPGRLFTQKVTFPLIPDSIKKLVIRRMDHWPKTFELPFKQLLIYNHCGSVYGENESIYTFIGPWVFKLYRNGTYAAKQLPSPILSFYRDSLTGRLYTGLVRDGIHVLDSSLTEVQHLGIAGRTVSSLTTDLEGNLWFTTLENGAYFSASGSIFKRNFTRLPFENVQRVFNDQDKNLLLAGPTKLELLHQGKLKTILTYPNTGIGDVFLGKEGTVYLMGGLLFDNGRVTNTKVDGIPLIKRVFAISGISHETQIINDSILVLNPSFILVTKNMNRDRLPGQEKKGWDLDFPRSPFNIQAIFKKDRRSLFLASMQGLSVLNLPDRKLTPFLDKNMIFKNGVTYIQQMKNGLFIMGVRFGGLALLDDTTVVGRITESEGLINNSIKYILPIDDRLWIATPKGISVVQFTSYKPVRYMIRNFGESSGMSDQVIYQLTLFRGNILVVTSKGVYEISNIEAMLREQPLPIPLYITSVNYYRGDTSGITKLSVPYNNSRVTVNFSAVCFNSPKLLKYFYRFSNHDSTWYNINSPQLVLQDLAPGSYELEIKVEMPEQNRRSSIERLHIQVAKPWWQWIWIWLLAAFFIFLGFYVFYKERIAQVEKREEEKAAFRVQMADLEQTALRSQMNPHFIFNCLSSIQQLVVTGNKEEANEYLVKFARLIRKTLEYSGRQYISVEEEMNYLREYMVLEELRIPGKFKFTITVDPDIDRNKIQIPNMMLQPIVENSIRHGIKHLEKPGAHIAIDIIKEDPYIRFAVTDNGIGRKASGQTGIDLFAREKSFGMDIVQKRLALIEGGEKKGAKLVVEDLYAADGSAAGTKVIILMPYKEANNDKSNSY